jgi:PAS domain S-box-containing protein
VQSSPLPFSPKRVRGSNREFDWQRRVRLLDLAFSHAPEPVAVRDREGRIRYANPACATLFGDSVDALVGRAIADFARHRECASAEVGTEPDCVLRGDFELSRPDGDQRWIRWSASPLRSDSGLGVGVSVFLRDETDQRHRERTARRRLEELEETLRGVAHDLRSPLVAVLGFSRLLHDDFAGLLGARGAHYLDRITDAGRNMEALIRELLDFARIGNAGERAVLVDPRATLEQLYGEFKPRLDAAGATLRWPAEPPLVLCDRTRLYQVLSNLIGNALDHMGPCENPLVEVEVREEIDRHLLVVRDNGRGVDLSERERVFEMFCSIPREGGRKGTGIGLAIVKKIAELHGGRAWVEDAPGAGAAFHVSLPRPDASTA